MEGKYRFGRLVTTALCLIFMIAIVGCKSVQESLDVSETMDDLRERLDLEPEVLLPFGEPKPDLERRKAELLGKTLTIESMVQLALLNSPMVKTYYEDLSVHNANLKHDKMLQNPRFHLDILESFQEDDLFFRERDAQFHLAVTIDLIDLLTRPHRGRISETQLEIAKLELSEKMLDFTSNVVKAAITYKAELQNLALVQEIAQGVHAQLELALEQHLAGNISDLNLTEHQMMYQDMKIEMLEHERRVKVARESLNKFMGLWKDSTNWEMDSSLPDLSKSPLSLSTLEQNVINNNLGIQSAKFHLAVLRSERSTARWKIIPSLEAGFTREEEDFHIPASGGTTSFEIPIFNWNQAEVAKIDAFIRRKENEIEQMGIRIRSDLRLLHDQLVELQSKLEYYEDTILPTHERYVTLSQKHYNAMFIGTYELLDAKKSELIAQREYVEVQKKYWISRTEVDHALAGGHIGEVAHDKPLIQIKSDDSDRHGH